MRRVARVAMRRRRIASFVEEGNLTRARVMMMDVGCIHDNGRDG